MKERLHFAAPEAQEGIRQSIWNHDKTSLALWLDTAESDAEGTDELQDVERLLYQQRGPSGPLLLKKMGSDN